MSKLKELLRSPWAIAAGLLLLAGITYGVLISTMGVYWDDWPSLWFLHYFGPTVFPQAFAADRPVQGWLFVLTTSLLGESLFAWQVFAIACRWITALALGWLLLSIWPKSRLQVLGVLILFIVYPGLSQQYIAITQGHQMLIMGFFFVSLTMMVYSIRSPKRYLLYTMISLLIGVLCMFALEYYFGLELLRPVILWLLLAEFYPRFSRRLVETIKRWIPYLAANLGFLVWRMSHFTPRGEVTVFKNLAANPSALSELARKILIDIYETGVTAWLKTFGFLNFSGIKTSVLTVYIGVVLSVTVLGAILMLLVWTKSSREPGGWRNAWGLTAMLVGLYALFIGGWPVWVTDLRIDLAVPWNRLTQPMMIGACLALVGLIDLLIRPHLPKILLIAVLGGVAAGSQFHNALLFRQEWIDQRNFFWQLAWRVPALKPGTLLLTSNLPFYSSTDNSLSAPINWIYAPDLKTREMPLLMSDINARLGNQLPSLDPGTVIEETYRATKFKGTTSQSVVFNYDPPRCLKILDLYTDRHYPNKPGYVVLALPLSNQSLIAGEDLGTAELPPFLGPELKHTWCYYFEKVDLAVQRGQWEKAAEIADQALKIKPELTSDNAPELIPFVYAYARAGKYDKAREISLQAGKLSKKMHYYMCDTWFYLSKQIKGDPVFDQVFDEINSKFECTPP